MVKSDLMDKYKVKDSSCGSKSNWTLVRMCTCKAAVKKSNEYVSGKKYIKYSLFQRQCKVNQPARIQRKKGAKKNRKNSKMNKEYNIFFEILEYRVIFHFGQFLLILVLTFL
jgi:hypothetical protein